MIKLRLLSIIAAFMLLALSLTGVYATWSYFDPPESLENELDVGMGLFEWKPEEILPTESKIGENHMALIELILNESKKGYGLNYDKKQVLESYLNSKGIIFSNQKTTGGNIKFVSDATSQLYYCVEKVSDTLYYAYTFAYDDVNAAKGTTDKIPVFRTALEKTDKWRAPKSYFGYALVKHLSAFSASAVSGELSYTIDPSTWAP